MIAFAEGSIDQDFVLSHSGSLIPRVRLFCLPLTVGFFFVFEEVPVGPVFRFFFIALSWTFAVSFSCESCPFSPCVSHTPLRFHLCARWLFLGPNCRRPRVEIALRGIAIVYSSTGLPPSRPTPDVLAAPFFSSYFVTGVF